MVRIRITVCNICSTHFYIGKNRYRWGKFQSCDSHPNGCCRNYGVGNGISHECATRHFGNQQKKLDIFNFIWSSYGSLLALLLSRIANRRSFKSSAHRQAKRGHYIDSGFYVSARGIYCKITDRMYSHRHWNFSDGSIALNFGRIPWNKKTHCHTFFRRQCVLQIFIFFQRKKTA